MKAAGANIKWPDNFTTPDGSSDTDGAVLGYVRTVNHTASGTLELMKPK